MVLVNNVNITFHIAVKLPCRVRPAHEGDSIWFETFMSLLVIKMSEICNHVTFLQ